MHTGFSLLHAELPYRVQLMPAPQVLYPLSRFTDAKPPGDVYIVYMGAPYTSDPCNIFSFTYSTSRSVMLLFYLRQHMSYQPCSNDYLRHLAVYQLLTTVLQYICIIYRVCGFNAYSLNLTECICRLLRQDLYILSRFTGAKSPGFISIQLIILCGLWIILVLYAYIDAVTVISVFSNFSRKAYTLCIRIDCNLIAAIRHSN